MDTNAPFSAIRIIPTDTTRCTESIYCGCVAAFIITTENGNKVPKCNTHATDDLLIMRICMCCMKLIDHQGHYGRYWLCTTCDSDLQLSSPRFSPVCGHYNETKKV